jgi:hypothetical protein
MIAASTGMMAVAGHTVPIRHAHVLARPWTPSRPGVQRHLVIAYRPGWQSLQDLGSIARHISDIDPSIETFVVSSISAGSVSRRLAARLPSLVVSTGRLLVFKPLRGKIYQGWPMPKLEELRRLASAGLPVPRTAVLTPDLKLDPSVWGEFVILKPTDIATSSHGRGIQLMRTARVRYIRPQDYPADHPGRLGPMVVQQFIDTGQAITTYRVLTLFGEPLYAQLNVADGARVDLAASDEVIENAPIALQTARAREGQLTTEPEVLALARAAHAAVPEIPLKGTDILRDTRTGKLYVIELNSGGNTWHFSSQYSASIRRSYGPEYELGRRQQFDSLRTAARVLVERTNAEAE